ncbi:hypothetical protein AB4114_29555, partial [Paenibacillus sp. 2RAB27]|uniref:hypothetical protein n=1 Tax=Paenibacillus sp. 2RAB27 TaxID=3232991 RepID=UPI003F9A0931
STCINMLVLCDDCLSSRAKVSPRNAVNQLCRKLSNQQLIIRNIAICNHCQKQKNVNRINTSSHDSFPTEVTIAPSISSTIPITPDVSTWFWEGNIQSRVVGYLASKGYLIRSVANTAARTPGKDIVALDPNGKELWVSVKGYPEKSPNTQARHWFSSAIFDLILYHGENPEVTLAIAFPQGFQTYSNLVPRILWLKDSLPFTIYWVDETGNVTVE